MKRRLTWRINVLRSEILFEDDHLLVLNKAPNLLVLPDRFNPALPNLYTTLTEELGKVFIVHRIDRETSGVVLFARTAEAHAGLNRQFERREVLKLYQVIVAGVPARDGGIINAPLAVTPHEAGVMRIDRKRGKEAITEYFVLERFRRHAFVQARPITGRMHQIRVHLQSIGLPIVGDGLYCDSAFRSSGQRDSSAFFLSQIKARYKPEGVEKPLLERTALHALAISFTHPLTHERVEAEAPLPKDMRSVLNALRKYGK